MDDSRPNPDTLLADLQTAEAHAARGHLKIFFGAAPGVGKTYAMLEEARQRASEGMDLVIGYAEPHIRPDTEQLLLGLEIQRYLLVPYKGTTLKEFDLEAILRRRPALVCVDELAHTNAPGLRHAKRFQDVLELLEAGINVYTTLNVQHLESVNDIVERTSGIKVRETLPDWVLEQADEVQLIDLPPDKLIERMVSGKIYQQHDPAQLTKNFFNQGNLSALRELALRRTADRVDAQMAVFQKQMGSTSPWPTAERMLVCIGPSPFSIQLIRATRRLAATLKSQWFAVYVETPQSLHLAPAAKERITQALRLAESLGGRAVTLAGNRPADEIIAFARTKNIARIVTGKPQRSRWQEFFHRSLVDELIHKAGALDILILREEQPAPSTQDRLPPLAPKLGNYAVATLLITLTSAIGWFLYHVVGQTRNFSNTNVLMLDLLGILYVALRLGRGPAVLASALSVLAFDVTVVPPYYSLAVSDTQYLVTFAAMFATALIISTLTDKLYQQNQATRLREQRTSALLELARELTALQDKQPLVETATRHIAQVFHAQLTLLLPNEQGELSAVTSNPSPVLSEPKEYSVAVWVYEHGQIAGATTDTLPSAQGLYIPLQTGPTTLGVLALFGPQIRSLANPDRLRLLEAFANVTALALQRSQLATTAQQAWERVETEFVRNTLLSGVSHDMRTPLAAITGSISTLLENGDAIPPAERRELLESVADEADHMERLITNLLDMTRLESGHLQLKLEPYPLSEIIGSALSHFSKRLSGRSMQVHIPADLPLVQVDGSQMEQVFTNLLDNALQYTPPGSPLTLTATLDGAMVEVVLADQGPGLPSADPERVFQKFYRSPGGPDAIRRGVGLGLAICRQIIELHHGTIHAANRPTGGAAFTLRIPATQVIISSDIPATPIA